jgi:hypothetical protein
LLKATDEFELTINPVFALLSTDHTLKSSPVIVTVYDAFEKAVPNNTDDVYGDPPKEATDADPAFVPTAFET